jgi:hypothetical protein
MSIITKGYGRAQRIALLGYGAIKKVLTPYISGGASAYEPRRYRENIKIKYRAGVLSVINNELLKYTAGVILWRLLKKDYRAGAWHQQIITINYRARNDKNRLIKLLRAL